jgi:hypothetical protein
VGVALAKALTINKTLRMLCLSADAVMTNRDEDNKVALGPQSYKAFSAMHLVNTSVAVTLPDFDAANADESNILSFNQMLIEQGLNEDGRGRLLSSSQTPREE